MKKIAALLFFLIFFVSCGEKTVNLADVQSNEMQFAEIKSGDIIATIKTDLGDIKVVLYPNYAPLAVDNFVTHAQNGYYNGVSFHRVIENFVIQSGDPTGTGSGGESIWQLPFSDEFSDKLHHYTGALSMANYGENTNGSQFFIVVTNTATITDETVSLMQNAGWREDVINTYKQAGGLPYLDYSNTVFGQVYEGLDIAFKISFAQTDENDRPEEDILIQSIEITTVE